MTSSLSDLLVFLILLGVPIGFMVWTYTWVSKADIVEGHVLGVEEATDKRGRKRYSSQVVYEIDGERLEFISRSSTDTPEYRVGERVKVFVSQDRKRIATVTDLAKRYIMPILMVVCLLLIQGLSIIYQHQKMIISLLHPQLV
ncbi:DUF3592 domain-containing protein [Acaryochloris sp. CCMEE 5410]|uniref:DUF3592 domain-containing protein n=1 Tax=Acaryochloris sp. CCMEE 5410 TaxID=310037 RepID=UPI0004943740|nr:DUF3592 domain-containing protein [Acaryochloris sp. CCMEE 5410]